jgi:hypothetical protein
MILNYLGIITESGLNSKGSRGDFNNFGQFAVIKLVHIVADPFTTTEDIGILFTVIRKKILTQVSIKARRAILTASTIILGLILFIPARAHITTINQFGGKFFAVVVGAKNATQPFGIRIPVMIAAQNASIRKFDSDSSTSRH